MKKNPQIIITSIGTRWVNYRIILPRGNGSTEVRGAARINEPVDIPIEEGELVPEEHEDDPLREVERKNCAGVFPINHHED
jgi:hypothetical protein